MISVADYRFSRNDIGIVKDGRVDLLARVSKDDGCTWGNITTVIAGKGKDVERQREWLVDQHKYTRLNLFGDNAYIQLALKKRLERDVRQGIRRDVRKLSGRKCRRKS